jgi:hypothetical protein
VQQEKLFFPQETQPQQDRWKEKKKCQPPTPLQINKAKGKEVTVLFIYHII